MSSAQTWRPQCYVCSRFVAIEAYDVSWDYYNGGWEEGYTACPEHGGPKAEQIAAHRARCTEPWEGAGCDRHGWRLSSGTQEPA